MDTTWNVFVSLGHVLCFHTHPMAGTGKDYRFKTIELWKGFCHINVASDDFGNVEKVDG